MRSWHETACTTPHRTEQIVGTVLSEVPGVTRITIDVQERYTDTGFAPLDDGKMGVNRPI